MTTTPVGNHIPDLTTTQYDAFREYTHRHRQLRDKLAPHPILIARVLADDKRGASMKPPTGVVPDEYDGQVDYLQDLFEQMGLVVSQRYDNEWYYVARSAWRLDLLPTNSTYTDAYHRRCGVFFDYPLDAIDAFINSDEVQVTLYDIARAGLIDPADIAYLSFVSYLHRTTIPAYEKLIEQGKDNRERIAELSNTWDIPALDIHANDVYEDYVAAYSGSGSTWTPPMTIPPDADVTADDVRPLLS